ncbi:MAG: hypothetical protein NVSMB12_00560 [Acidimicrobiales bacterium]
MASAALVGPHRTDSSYALPESHDNDGGDVGRSHHQHTVVTWAGAHPERYGKTSRNSKHKEIHLKITHTLAGGAVALLAVGGFGAFTGLAQASANTPAKVQIQAPAPAVDSGANVQEGDQSAPDTATTAETPGASEKAGAEADGPGGHEDPPGSAGADTQQ